MSTKKQLLLDIRQSIHAACVRNGLSGSESGELARQGLEALRDAVGALDLPETNTGPIKRILVRNEQPKFKKIQAIKAVRACLGLALKDAKYLVDQAPSELVIPWDRMRELEGWLSESGYDLIEGEP